uniref:Polyphenol oxidase n=2 Tax=Cynara cardunculus var. scolymus TaxID=59895 RepID=R4JGK9_CYNCS|nr:polyphenol oxidase [Cynara cardunculus var. scolymus]
MASFSFSTLPTTFSGSPSFSKASSHRFKVSCNAASGDTNHPETTPKLITSLDMTHNVDRRNLLLGLGGLYGAANFTSLPSAFATPIAAPDNIADCVTASSNLQNPTDVVRGLACCPPALSSKPEIYTLPVNPVTRIRPAAQRATPEYIEKYKAAIQEMRKLPDDHPHSFKQQAMIHCAYCNGAYNQEQSGHPELQLQIHNSWLFYPFHRWYLYFYERILGKLINDPTFAIPHWNWDHPTGMMLPAMFEDADPALKQNPIFDPYRDVTHLPPAILDAEYAGANTGADCVNQISSNLASMYRQMITNATDTTSFSGGEFVSGDDPLQAGTLIAGSIERGIHTAMHRWVGNPRMANNEDMGNFYSAGYDPVFYVHHANVDRMWKIWNNASYVFYDENEKLVRVFNKDSIDIGRMGYDYERSSVPWLQSRPVAHAKRSKAAAQSVGTVKKVEDVEFPVKLDQVVKVLVKRPATNRTKEDKEKAHEILLLNGIKFDGEKFVKFDVFVNDVDDGIETTAAESEFAGSFAQLPHGSHSEKMLMTSGARFGITELLEDIEAEDDEYVLVNLVPKIGCDDAIVSEIKIELVPIVQT